MRAAAGRSGRAGTVVTDAPGWPGIPPSWTSSARTGAATALSQISRVWFTTSPGILNEIYHPRVDHVCTRDFGLIVTGGNGSFAEEKRDSLRRSRRWKMAFRPTV